MNTIGKHPFIVQTPGTCGGRSRIDGHRIRVSQIASMYEHDAMTPDQICEALPSINLTMVHAALAYYYENREEIEREIREDAEIIEQYKRTHRDGQL